MSTTLLALTGCAVSTSAVVAGAAAATAVGTVAAVLDSMTPEEREAYMITFMEEYAKKQEAEAESVREIIRKHNDNKKKVAKKGWFS